MDEKIYNIRNAKALLRSQVVSSADTEMQNFTPEVRCMEGAIDAIDIYDNFDELKIKPEVYSAPSDEAKYGIHYVPAIHRAPGNARIMPWQTKAAYDFLKTLRGFGLLADVVGSGKTYEACVVLSELVYRGEVGSVLIVVPTELIGNWKKVLEMDFGLGEGMLHHVTQIAQIVVDEEGRPLSPTIASLDDVRQWVQADGGIERIADIAFDLIVVDEAHQLCESSNSCVMSCLSRIIARSNEEGQKNVYCLLLSATPHDGDLASMFDLWYFIHTRGLDPHALGDVAYAEAMQKYIDEEWYGAKNVSDFIRKCKLVQFDITESGISLEELRQSMLGEYTGHRPYDDLNEWQKVRVVEAYLGRHTDAARTVEDRIAQVYKATLGKIMVRQGDAARSTLMRKKKTVNAFFLPVRTEATAPQIQIQYDAEALTLMYDGLDFPDRFFPKVKLASGEVKNMDKFLAQKRAKWQEYADVMVPAILGELLRHSDRQLMPNYGHYFSQMFRHANSYHDSGAVTDHTETNASGTYNLVLPYTGDSTANKLNALVNILKRHPNERVIVFFDYSLESNEAAVYADGRHVDSLYDRVESHLAGVDLGGRIIASLVDTTNDEAAARANENALAVFNADDSDSCVLLVKSTGYTKGANLQKASVIVNFQVSCDPIDMEQKIGRIFRLGQTRDVTVYSLVDIDQLEGYALAYFAGIGLFEVNNGDATILAGSNLTDMETVRCQRCGRPVIITRADYDAMQEELDIPPAPDGTKRYIRRVDQNFAIAYVCDSKGEDMGTIDLTTDPDLQQHVKDSELLCNDVHQGLYYVRTQVAGNVYECSNDRRHVFRRSSNAALGYQCMNRAVTAPMTATGSHQFSCDKLCVVKHCRYHSTAFPNCVLHTKSDAEISRIIADVGNYALAIDKMCSDCIDKDRCKNDRSHACCPMGAADSSACLSCRERNNTTCYAVHPHRLQFDDAWHAAACPVPGCGGVLQSKVMSRFSDHIAYLWEANKGQNQSFCDLLLREAKNVRELKEILDRSTT